MTYKKIFLKNKISRWLIYSCLFMVLQVQSSAYTPLNKWSNYINQVGAEATLIQGLLEHTQDYYNKFDGQFFWNQPYLFGSPHIGSNKTWFTPQQTLYVENAYTQLSSGTIDVVVDFGKNAYIHPDLSQSRVVFTGVDSQGNPIRKNHTLAMESKHLLNHWTCSVKKHQNRNTKSLGYISNMHESPLFIASLLPYPYSLCQEK